MKSVKAIHSHGVRTNRKGGKGNSAISKCGANPLGSDAKYVGFELEMCMD